MLVKMPSDHGPERSYTVSVVLEHFLGVSFEPAFEARSNICVVTNDGKELHLSDGLFAHAEEDWLSSKTLPMTPLPIWKTAGCGLDLPDHVGDLPVIYGDNPNQPDFLKLEDESIRLGLDIFGSIFFMLTRYEEAVLPDRDDHDRFPHEAALAFREGFLERAIVNEYLEVLWTCLHHLWPGLKRRPRAYRVAPSHDVDRPLSIAGASPLHAMRTLAGDLVKRHDPDLARRRAHAISKAPFGVYDIDPANSFDFIMGLSERHGLQSAFYFITGHTGGAIDGCYSIDSDWIRSLMRDIHARGHEIGLHPSYNTYKDENETCLELQRLKRAAQEEGIQQDRWGGRQHYLRWRPGTTWRNWERAGLDYDSTLGFPGHVGFRAGTCYEYPVFDLQTRRSLALIERPLIAMDVTLLSNLYMGLDDEAVIRRCADLARTCKAFGGIFTLLWHNDNLASRKQKTLYQTILDEVTAA